MDETISPNMNGAGRIRCAGVKKSDCRDPCTWVKGKGCKNVKPSPIKADSTIPKKMSKILQSFASPKKKSPSPKKKSPMSSSSSSFKSASSSFKSASPKLNEVEALRFESKQLKQRIEYLSIKNKEAEVSAKKDLALMKDLNKKTLMLSSRLDAVEYRLKQCNKDRDRLYEELKAVRDELS